MDWSGALFGDEPEEPTPLAKTPIPAPPITEVTPEPIVAAEAAEVDEPHAPIVDVARSLVETFTADVMPQPEGEDAIEVDDDAFELAEAGEEEAIEVAVVDDEDVEPMDALEAPAPSHEYTSAPDFTDEELALLELTPSRDLPAAECTPWGDDDAEEVASSHDHTPTEAFADARDIASAPDFAPVAIASSQDIAPVASQDVAPVAEHVSSQDLVLDAAPLSTESIEITPASDSPVASIEITPAPEAAEPAALASIDLAPREPGVPAFVSWADDSSPEVEVGAAPLVTPTPTDALDPISAFDATFSEEAASIPPPLPHLREAKPIPTIEDLELPPPLPPYERASTPEDPSLRYRVRVAPERGPRSKGVIGIDLGTTYSCAAIVEDGRARMLASRQGGPTIASVVRYAEDGRTVVGTTAARSAARHPERTILGSKRLMGRAFTSPVVQDVQHHFAYDVVPGREGEAAIRVQDEVIALEDVAASILEEIREAAALQLEESVNRAVITCPAHFTEPQREAVRRAGELAGFYVERVLNEPTAAALNYAADHHVERRRIVVYDLGGGTFDVSVLEVDGDVFEVLATGGDSFLGGLDFDACIVEMLSEALLEQEHLDAREDPAAVAKLFEFAERAKRDLSERTSTIVQIDHLVVQPYAARSISVGLRRVTVERAFAPLVAQTLEIVEDTVSRAGLTLNEIDDIVLVGGQSRAPIVRQHVEALFGRPPLARVDPEEAVALGAARFAASLDTIDDIILIDALPLSIGVGLPGGRFKPLLSRDARLPASRTYHVRTTRDDQADYEIALFQGESDRVEDNEPLGILTLSDLPKGPRGTVKIEVTLAVDAESVLEVRACEPSSGQLVSARMVTKGTAEELRVRLGLPAQPTHEEIERRRAKKLNRPKKVWRWITGLFRRER